MSSIPITHQLEHAWTLSYVNLERWWWQGGYDCLCITKQQWSWIQIFIIWRWMFINGVGYDSLLSLLTFTLMIDYQSLEWFMESDKLTWKLVRWTLLLQEYDFTIIHKVGFQNLYVDGSSHNLTHCKKI